LCKSGWIASTAILVVQALGWAQSPVELADGQLVVGWISTSSFHFCRAWGEDKCAPRVAAVRDDVKVERAETGSQVRLSTERVVVEIDKKDGRLRVLDTKDNQLMSETAAVARAGREITVERVAQPGEAFYGLGVRADPRADGRGQVIESTKAFLVSSVGYGLHHDGPGNYRFDLASSKPDRYVITARPALRFEYYFYYGPRFKSVLEEHMLVVAPRGYQSFGILSRADLPEGAALVPSPPEGSWESLGAAVRSLVHASLSAVPSPVFDLGPYRRFPGALFRRAAQLASVSPLVCDTGSGLLVGDTARSRYELAEWRRRLRPFLAAYADEVGYRGYPILHPLPLQYPNDKEAGKFADQFMVGDELLAAPIYSESNRRSVYFPMGNWTDLRTNRVYPGRQRVEVLAGPDSIPLFLRNGSILPLESEVAGGPMELHYTPSLAAEFFLYEPGISRYSQLHASPALDLMRLEIDSRQTRSYEWVVHHMPAAREVKTGETVYVEVKDRRSLRPGAWYYDRARENLHIMVSAPAGQVRVTHIAF
jgi:alpha-glucosidase (family GH31 glycosyl hydrolase)